MPKSKECLKPGCEVVAGATHLMKISCYEVVGPSSMEYGEDPTHRLVFRDYALP